MGWIILAVVIVAGVASVVGQVMKAQREAAPRPRRGGQPDSGKGSEFDRFLAEIERLKQKPAPAAAAPPVAVPVAKKPKRSKRRVEETAPVAVPVAAPVRNNRMFAADPIPVVTTLSRGTTQAPKTDNGKLLLTLLGNPQSVPAAIVLTEVLGPPKCRRPWSRGAGETNPDHRS